MSELEDQILFVKVERESLERFQSIMKERKEQFALENKELIEKIAKGSTTLSAAETDLRILTLKAYEEDPTQKKFCDGKVGIRIVKRLNYDAADALA